MRIQSLWLWRWFGVAEIQDIFEDAIGTVIFDEELPEDHMHGSQELLGEEISEKIRVHEFDEPMEDVGH